LDTATAVQMVQYVDVLLKDVADFVSLSPAAPEYMMTPCIGRSHGIHARTVTFGYKLALMYDELVGHKTA
jgi:adenylosuccinate lyase